MKNAICLTGNVLVSDILTAFEPMIDGDLLLKLDTELEGRADDRLMFDDTEVLAHQAIDALDEADLLPEPESPVLDQTDVQNLAEVIRCGETERAELLLDRLFSGLPDGDAIREWIDRGRFSKKARQARQPKPLRKAA